MSALPEIIEIELNRRCNLACRMCQRQVVQARNPDAELGETVLATVLEQCDGYAPQINLGGLGESLLHRRLPHLLAQIKRHNPAMCTGFNTNGLRLTAAVDDWLLNGRVDFLSISLNAPDAEGYRWLVGGDAYPRVVEQARRFLAVKGKGNPPLTTVHVFALSRFTAATEAFIDAWRPWADFVQVRQLGNWGGTIDTAAFGAPPLSLGRCDRPNLSLAIDVAGGYHRCCASFALTNPTLTIFDVPIAQYWRGEEATRLRGEMQTGSFPDTSPCLRCSGRAIPANTVLEHAALAMEDRDVSA